MPHVWPAVVGQTWEATHSTSAGLPIAFAFALTSATSATSETSSLHYNQFMLSVRADKWLWAARFYKTRSLATRACDLSRVLLAGQPIKPSRELRVGNLLRISNDGGDFDVEILGLSDERGPAPIAQALYKESAESIERRQQVAAQRRAMAEWEKLPPTRPDKRDRRKIIQFRGRG